MYSTYDCPTNEYCDTLTELQNHQNSIPCGNLLDLDLKLQVKISHTVCGISFLILGCAITCLNNTTNPDKNPAAS